MADGEELKEFPDVNHKLTAPKKLSAFEKERQAAQAKEKRAEAENAAALKAFEDSFAGYDNSDDDIRPQRRGSPPPPGPRGPGFGYEGRGGRYGGPPGPRSGPGSLGPIPGPPPPSLKRKRALDEMRELQEARREQEMLGLDDGRSGSRGPQTMVQDDEREVDAPRPTIQLSSLPPGTTNQDIRALLKDHLEVHSVHIIPPVGPATNVKRSAFAIAALAADVSTTQIDTAVSALKEKYLGCGFYLSISRHLSSAALHPSMSTTTTAPSSEPFGAEKPRDQHARFSMRNAPPPMEHRGFAPPDSYDSPVQPYGNRNHLEATVSVRPPLNLEAIKAIHTVAERLLLEPNPRRALKIESQLMGRRDVQRDERFAFLYNSRSPAGVYYRFLLWSPEDPDEAIREMKRRTRGPERIHDDIAIEWMPPYAHVPFPDLKSLEQVVTDMDYVSSDEESDDEDGQERKTYSGREGEGPVETNEKKHLTPLKRARIVHLLSRLPTSNSKLRKGDVARVTNFAINHAGSGAEEIVDLLLLNVEKPFSYSLAAKYEELEHEQDEEDIYEPDEDLSNLDSPAPQTQNEGKRGDDDPSNAKLIGLYLISDILSASSTAGARNAWKYRNLFEQGFKQQKTFERLGKLERELDWGRLKAEQWKRRVDVVFGIWESWSVFSSDVLEELKMSFFEPPMSDEEKAAAVAQAEKEERKRQEEKWMGKFKRVDQVESPGLSASPAPAEAAVAVKQVEKDEDGAPIDDIDGAPMEEDVDGKPMDDDVDGKPMDDDLDGAPMDGMDGVPMDDDVGGAPMSGVDGTANRTASDAKLDAKIGSSDSSTKPAAMNGKSTGPRRRMRAEDMFADSDDE